MHNRSSTDGDILINDTASTSVNGTVENMLAIVEGEDHDMPC